MKRKMLKEEKELREFVRAAVQNLCDSPTAMKMITALARAARAEERERCAQACAKAYRNGDDAVQAIREGI